TASRNPADNTVHADSRRNSDSLIRSRRLSACQSISQAKPRATTASFALRYMSSKAAAPLPLEVAAMRSLRPARKLTPTGTCTLSTPYQVGPRIHALRGIRVLEFSLHPLEGLGDDPSLLAVRRTEVFIDVHRLSASIRYRRLHQLRGSVEEMGDHGLVG